MNTFILKFIKAALIAALLGVASFAHANASYGTLMGVGKTFGSLTYPADADPVTIPGNLIVSPRPVKCPKQFPDYKTLVESLKRAGAADKPLLMPPADPEAPIDPKCYAISAAPAITLNKDALRAILEAAGKGGGRLGGLTSMHSFTSGALLNLSNGGGGGARPDIGRVTEDYIPRGDGGPGNPSRDWASFAGHDGGKTLQGSIGTKSDGPRRVCGHGKTCAE